MEIRTLRYFLAVAQERNFTAAAASLHITQPTLSRQIMDLEEELGQTLFVRSKKAISLTQEGQRFRQYAEAILTLVGRAEQDMHSSEETITGEIHIGGAESEAVREILRILKELRRDHPGIRLYMRTIPIMAALEMLDAGLLDFAVILSDHVDEKYHSITLSHREKWGLLMPRSSPLAARRRLAVEDLRGLPLLLPGSPRSYGGLADDEVYTVVGRYDLFFLGAQMVEEGLGYALGIMSRFHRQHHPDLCIREVSIQDDLSLHLVWKKNTVQTKAAAEFLRRFRVANAQLREEAARFVQINEQNNALQA